MTNSKGKEARFAALAALYAELPAMACAGLCSDSCFSLVQTGLERDYTQARTGVRLDLVQVPPMACPALTMLNQCGVYTYRSMICRLWGMTPGMRCQYGCEPEGGFLTGRQTYEFLARAADLAGHDELAAQLRQPFQDDPERAENILMMLQRGRDLEYDDRVRKAGDRAVYLIGQGRLTKERPRGGRW